MSKGCCIIGCRYYGNHNQTEPITYHVFPDPKRDLYRHNQWRSACNNPRLLNKDCHQVYGCYRICRLHFDKDSMNGSCKRLLNTAVPTLHLHLNGENDDEDVAEQPADLESVVETVAHTESVIKISSPGRGLRRKQLNTTEHSSDEVDDDDAPSYKRQRLQSPADVFEESDSDTAVIDNKDDHRQSLDEIEWIEMDDNEYPDDIESNLNASVFEATPINEETVAAWRSKFYSCPKNRLAQNVCSRVDPFEVCISRQAVESTQHVFAHRVETEGKPMTNQKNSGRCWLFAALNCIRIPFAKYYNLEEFEFSQGYLFFWDKIERCHYFLNNIVATAKRGEEVNGRLVSFLLNDPTCDGGQWDMLVNLIKKYGLMPKKYFPESFCCESSMRLNAVLKSKLREYTKVLRELLADADKTDADVQAALEGQMAEIYNVVGICLGIPAAEFTWEYTDKTKTYKSVGPVTPVQFYEEHVRHCYNVDDKVVLMTDPRPSNQYNQMYTVDCLGNVVGGRPVLYNNQPVEFLMDMVAASIKSGEPIWFGCEVSKRFAVKLGIEDLTIHDFKLVFGVDIQTTMSKADRLLYGESAMTHAMVFTAVTCDDDGRPTKFRVENSWGEDRGDKGYLYMSADWFKEFVFEVVVDKAHVPADVLAVMEKQPIVLPAWDPMGTLAE